MYEWADELLVVRFLEFDQDRLPCAHTHTLYLIDRSRVSLC